MVGLTEGSFEAAVVGRGSGRYTTAIVATAATAEPIKVCQLKGSYSSRFVLLVRRS